MTAYGGGNLARVFWLRLTVIVIVAACTGAVPATSPPADLPTAAPATPTGQPTASATAAPTTEPTATPTTAPTTTPPVSTVAGTLTLTPDSCTYEGAAQLLAGKISFSLINQTATQLDIDLWLMQTGHTYQEFSDHVAEENRRITAGEPPLGHPGFATLVGEASTEPVATGTFAAELTPGTYGIACIPFDDRPLAFYALGPIEIGEAQAGGPAARGYHGLASVGEHGVMLYAGETAPPPEGGEALTDTWLFAGDRGWTESSADGPGLWGTSPVFDSQSGRAILLANVRGFADVAPETWAYDPSSDAWRRMAPAEMPAWGVLAYDSESDRVISFGDAGQTWAYDYEGDSWTMMSPGGSPPARAWHALAYDEQSDRVILFGGETAGGQLADTWAYDFNSDSWAELAPDAGAPARMYHAMAYDPVGDRVILFGGTTGVAEQPLGDTWSYDYESNTWTELSPVASPSARGWHAIAYSVVDGQIVLFGGGSTRTPFQTETWLFDPAAGTWSEFSGDD